jgi:DNA-binding beta-propeller fold protein YncE
LLACAGPESTTIVGGLTNPRSLALLPDGRLIVAEAGTGRNDGRIVRVGSGGAETIVEGLPSWPYTPTEIVGPGGLVAVGEELQWVQGLGPDDRYSTLSRRRGGTTEVLAGFRLSAQGAPDGDTRISNPFDLLVEPDGTAFVSDASANVVWRVDPERRVRAHVSWTAIENPVPTGLARAPDGSFYVALFSQEPHVEGSGRVARFDREGNKAIAVEGLTAPIALEVAPDGALLVLEFAHGFAPGQPIGFAPCSGRLLRIADGRSEVLHDRLQYPTDVVLAPDGGYYVTVVGAFGAGDGRVERLPARQRALSLSSRSGQCRG